MFGDKKKQVSYEGLKKSHQKMLYAYSQQALKGDNKTSKPFLLDFYGREMWAAWYAEKGTSIEEAELKFIHLAKAVLKSKGKDYSDPEKHILVE